jgi:dTDP-4-dehydrorhamnose reductase
MYWVTGAKGMLGTDMCLLLQKNGIEYIGTGSEIDITKMTKLENFSKGKKIDNIINCAAYTDVDAAEDDILKCYAINTTGATNIAKLAYSIKAKFVQISTDYVFNGQAKKPYVEDDEPSPICIYGKSKENAEQKILELNPDAFIVRTAWLYGKHGKNFVTTMINLMKKRDSVKVVNDQKGCPTYTVDLADALLKLTCKDKITPGIFHFSNEGHCTWFEFAQEIYRIAQQLKLLTKVCNVVPCTSSEFPSSVKRPENSVLSKRKIKTALKLDIPHWQVSLKEYLKDLASSKT